MTPPARLLFPAGVTAAHRSLEPFDEVRILGGEPHQSHSGTPNPSSRFGVKAIRNLEVNLSPQWTPYGARRSVNGAPLCPVAPEQPSRARERRPPSTVRKGTPPAIEANRVGDGLQNRQMAGFDSRNRLSSDAGKTGRMHAVAHPPYPNRRKSATDGCAPSVRLPRTDTVEPECGQCVPSHLAAIAQPVEHLPRK